MTVRVRNVCYPVTTLGPGLRLGVWLSGCRRRCPGCLSPELQESRPSDEIAPDALADALLARDVAYEGLTVSGGEPLDQADELVEFLKLMSPRIHHVILYTGYTYEEITSDALLARILPYVSVLIDGPYVMSLDDGLGIRGSSNQTAYVFSEEDDYPYDTCQRSVQTFVTDDVIFTVGLR